jgi:glucosylceramidase
MTRAVISTQRAPWRQADAADTNASPTIHRTGTRDQTWSGFGGCFNEMGWKQLSVLDESARRGVLEALFGRDDGCGLTACRVPIGANDYALSWYSLDEVDGDFAMDHFSIDRDKGCLIPYIRAALEVNPDITLFASPWSPPTWMKTPAAYNYGTLNRTEKNLQAYAVYFRKFVEAYAAEGITVRAVYVQNEPNSDQKFPSCIWTGAEMRDFIKGYLGPEFERAGLACTIGAGTIEREDFNAWPLTIMSDEACRTYVGEIGFQWAGKGAVQRTHQAWPELPLVQTENECCGGANSWSDAEHVFGLLQHYITNGVSVYAYWNMALPPGGRSTWGWPQNAMITVDAAAATVTHNPEFYVMKHFARFIRAGAVRHVLAGPWSANAVCLENTDGSFAYVVSNPLDTAQDIIVEGTGGNHCLSMESRSFATLVIE